MENPIFFHATDVEAGGFKKAIDRMAEVGFEMLIYSFGSGFNLETNNTTYINLIAEQVETTCRAPIPFAFLAITHDLWIMATLTVP